MAELKPVPKRADNIRVLNQKTESYVMPSGYSSQQKRVLATTTDDVEIEVSLRTYQRMERDQTISKAKKILTTNVLSDDLRFAPGATVDEVSEEEYAKYESICEFAERVVKGLRTPIRSTLNQIYGNGIRYGHGIAETTWAYRIDGPSKKDGDTKESLYSKTKTRLMPSDIKVKPRNSVRFVVDDFMNVLGLVPVNKLAQRIAPDEIIDREKFMVLTLNQEDEDPRGVSSYRPAINWYNLKTQFPSEMLRFILEESVPKAVGTLPPNMPPFEFERDENGDIIYDDPETRQQPRMLTGAESFKRQIENFRSGSGAVIPNEAKLEPFKKGLTGTGDVDIFTQMLKILNNAMEESILLQTLAQSEGEHQARSASEQVAQILYTLVFWSRWQLCSMLMKDLISVAVVLNFGEEALQYLPQISLGDFARRDWVEELGAISDGYFKGFIDDSQRPDLMHWLNLPKAGKSRQELGLESGAKQDVNGEPVQPNENRPDKSDAGKGRNDNNGTEKKNDSTRTIFGRSNDGGLGHNGGWFKFSSIGR